MCVLYTEICIILVSFSLFVLFIFLSYFAVYLISVFYILSFKMYYYTS